MKTEITTVIVFKEAIDHVDKESLNSLHDLIAESFQTKVTKAIHTNPFTYLITFECLTEFQLLPIFDKINNFIVDQFDIIAIRHERFLPKYSFYTYVLGEKNNLGFDKKLPTVYKEYTIKGMTHEVLENLLSLNNWQLIRWFQTPSVDKRNACYSRHGIRYLKGDSNDDYEKITYEYKFYHNNIKVDVNARTEDNSVTIRFNQDFSHAILCDEVWKDIKSLMMTAGQMHTVSTPYSAVPWKHDINDIAISWQIDKDGSQTVYTVDDFSYQRTLSQLLKILEINRSEIKTNVKPNEVNTKGLGNEELLIYTNDEVVGDYSNITILGRFGYIELVGNGHFSSATTYRDDIVPGIIQDMFNELKALENALE